MHLHENIQQTLLWPFFYTLQNIFDEHIWNVFVPKAARCLQLAVLEIQRSLKQQLLQIFKI